MLLMQKLLLLKMDGSFFFNELLLKCNATVLLFLLPSAVLSPGMYERETVGLSNIHFYTFVLGLQLQRWVKLSWVSFLQPILPKSAGHCYVCKPRTNGGGDGNITFFLKIRQFIPFQTSTTQLLLPHRGEKIQVPISFSFQVATHKRVHLFLLFKYMFCTSIASTTFGYHEKKS